MNILRKLFGHPAQGPAAAWEDVLNTCDLSMARDEIADMHRMTNAQAEREGGAHYYKQEYVAAWEAFRDDPTIENARTLVSAAPPLLKYFEMCSPGHSFHSTEQYLRERSLSRRHTDT